MAETITHNLNTNFIIVQVYLGSATPYTLTTPVSVEVNGPNAIQVKLASTATARVNVLPVYNLT